MADPEGKGNPGAGGPNAKGNAPGGGFSTEAMTAAPKVDVSKGPLRTEKLAAPIAATPRPTPVPPTVVDDRSERADPATLHDASPSWDRPGKTQPGEPPIMEPMLVSPPAPLAPPAPFAPLPGQHMPMRNLTPPINAAPALYIAPSAHYPRRPSAGPSGLLLIVGGLIGLVLLLGLAAGIFIWFQTEAEPEAPAPVASAPAVEVKPEVATPVAPVVAPPAAREEPAPIKAAARPKARSPQAAPATEGGANAEAPAPAGDPNPAPAEAPEAPAANPPSTDTPPPAATPTATENLPQPPPARRRVPRRLGQ
jgi:hypothetical protein